MFNYCIVRPLRHKFCKTKNKNLLTFRVDATLAERAIAFTKKIEKKTFRIMLSKECVKIQIII